jgi:lipoyl(octanoyl) transferase
VEALEARNIGELAEFGVIGEIRPGRVGVWVERGDSEDKIAAIGIRVRRWVSFHGISLNVAPNLEHFSGIVPCGIQGHGVTSLADLGLGASLANADAALQKSFTKIFGHTQKKQTPQTPKP